jgi:hypothetical protein
LRDLPANASVQSRDPCFAPEDCDLR